MDDETKSRFDATDGKLDRVEGRLDGVDARLDGVDAKLDRLETKVDRTEEKLDGLISSLDGRFASLAKLIEEQGESLQREMGANMERMEVAMGRNTKVLTGGSKAVAALTEWAEKRDKLDRKRDQELRDLRARIQRLEHNSKRRAS